MKINLQHFAVRLIENRLRDYGKVVKHKNGFYIISFDVTEINKDFAKVIMQEQLIRHESDNCIVAIAPVQDGWCLLTYKPL